MQTSTIKTSTIFVATGKKTRVFQSMDHVPSRLRKRMSDNLSGPNTRTLIVADRRGREYLLKVLQRATHSPSLLPQPEVAVEAPLTSGEMAAAWIKARRYWLEFALIGFLGAVGWALLSSK